VEIEAGNLYKKLFSPRRVVPEGCKELLKE
jgi:hypothetical protein